MTIRILTAATLVLAAASGAAFAKAHDQGVADGTQNFGPGEINGFVSEVVRNGASVLPDNDPNVPGNSVAETNRGKRSGVDPVVGNGKNANP